MAVEHLAALLKRFRGRAKLSQEELASRAGLSPRTVSDIERGVQLHPRQVTLEILSDALGIDDAQRRELRATASSSGIEPVPPVTAELLGRDHIIGELCSIFEHSGRDFVTVTGAPGVGKTVLARCVASTLAPHFPGGVAFVPFEDIRDPDEFLSTIARVLAVPERHRGAELRAEVVERLRMAPMLLVLDNIEHLVRAGPLVAELVQAIPTLSILATGTRAFNLSAEREMVLQPLGVADASALFVRRGSALLGEYAPDAVDREAIARLCGALEGLPLAIELAAMRLRSLTPMQIADHLWELLAQGPQDYPARHQALAAAIGWSYSLLNDAERDAFVRFAIFAGGASLEAAESVATLSASQVDALARQSLLVAEGSGAKRRLRMLAPIRTFALARLREGGLEDELGERHAAYFTKFAKTLNRRSREAVKSVAALFDAERQNFSRAWEWILTNDRWDLGESLIGSIAFLFELRLAFDESQRWFAAIVERSKNMLDLETRWNLLRRAGTPFQSVHDLEGAEPFAREALEVACALSSPGRIAASLQQLGSLRLDAGDVRGGLELFEQALEQLDEIGPFFPLYAFYNNVGFAYALVGEYERAFEYYTRSLDEADAVRNDIVRVSILQNIAELYTETEDYGAAESWLEQAVALADQLDYGEAAAANQLVGARIATLRGDGEAARKGLAVALEYFVAAAEPMQTVDTLREVVHYFARAGRKREAIMVGAFIAKRYGPQRTLPKLRAHYEAAEAKIKVELPPKEFDDVRRRGGELTIDDVLAMLLGQASATKL